jgi:hypothetical protein
MLNPNPSISSRRTDYILEYKGLWWTHKGSNLGPLPCEMTKKPTSTADAPGLAAMQQIIAYKRELLAGDIVEIRSALVEIRDKSICFQHRDAQASTTIT